MNKLLSVCIITRNRPKQVIEAIESVKQCTIGQENIEIVVYDNNDPNDSITFQSIRNQHPDVICTGMGGGNLGVCRSRNIAARCSSGRYLYFMDDDSWLHPDVFQPLIDALQNTEGAFMAEAHIRFIRDDEYMGPTGRERERPPFYLSLIECEGGICFERNTFFKIGGWNEHLFFGGEGYEISLRAFYLGYFGIMSMKSVAFHPSSSSSVKKAEIMDLHKKRLCDCIRAHCHIIRMDWPLLPAVGGLLKTASLTAYREARKNNDFFLGLKICCIALGTFFSCLPRYPHISKNRFWLFRKTYQDESLMEIIPGSQDYRQIIFGNKE